MKPIRYVPAALALAALLASSGTPGWAAGQSDDPFDMPFIALKNYDFQSRQPVEAIRQMIDAAAKDKVATGRIEQKLDDVLADANASFAGRQEAARFLWIIGTGRSVPVLSILLTDDKLSDVARYALERDSDPEAGKALLAALPAAQGRILVGIINSIGDRGDAGAVSALHPYLTSLDPLVAEAATIAIGKTGAPAAVSVLKSLPPENVTAGVALRLAAEKLAAEGRKTAAGQVYGLMCNPARPANIRGEGVRGLANLKAPNASTVALSALKSSDPYVQIVAAQAIASMDDPKTVTQAVATWPGLPVPVQVALLTLLAEKRDKLAAPIAAAATTGKDAALRTAGIRAESQVGGVLAVPRLIDVLVHGEGSDRAAARDAMASMPGADTERAILEQARTGMPETRAALIPVLVEPRRLP